MAMARDSKADLVLLHGWGTDPEVWRVVEPMLADRFRLYTPALVFGTADQRPTASDIVHLAERLAASAPARCFVCGWSLGGSAAIAWALRFPEQVARLALIAANPCFVQSEGWTSGLQSDDVDRLACEVGGDWRAALHRFIALEAQGDISTMHVARYLRRTLPTIDEAGAARLRAGLTLLKRTDLRGALPQLSQASLILHGDRDRVVPLAAADYMAANIRISEMSIIHGAAHAPFVSDPSAVCKRLEAFLA
jgi:pimeloyl-[acyl-carrier protein] methyl ester esterase